MSKGYIRVLDFRNDKGEFTFEFQPMTEDDIKEATYYIFIMMKKLATNLHQDFSSDLFRDFMKALMTHKTNFPDAQFHETTLRFYLNYKSGEAAPKVTARKYEDRVEYADEFTIINMQKKEQSLGFTFKARTDTAIYKSSFIIYFLLIRSGALLNAEHAADLYLLFKNVFEELMVKQPEQNHSNSLFIYQYDFNELKPVIRVREE